MSRKIFVNLPVQNLSKSMDFFQALGFTFNPQFTDETAACMIISDDIFAMLLTHTRFKDFIPKGIVDAKQANEVLVALSCENRAEVDQLMDKALAAGGETCRPAVDHGFMYGRSFHDLDGHIWELFWMDSSQIEQPPANQ